MRTAVTLLGTLALCAQSPHDPVESLGRARTHLIDALRRMPNYACVETVDRHYYRQSRSRGTCQDTLEYKRSGFLPRELTATDRLRLDVAFSESGREIFSWAGAGHFESQSIPEIIGGGPIGTGAFGLFLTGTFGAPEVRLVYQGKEQAGGKELFAYRFRVPSELSRYDLLVGGHRRVIPYEGTFRLNPETATLVELQVHTAGLASDLGICEATTTVEFAAQRIGGQEYLLPQTSRLEGVSVGAESENLTSYTGCREYRGASDIPFDGAARDGHALPKGLPVVLALEKEIDTDTAAAGDAVELRLSEPVVEKRSRRILAPAGALVRGRIVRMEHHLGDTPSFQIALLFQTLELNGARIPFAARLETRDGPLGEFTVSVPELASSRAWSPGQRDGDLSSGRILVFRTGQPRHVVPRGYISRWVTSTE